MIDIDMKQFGSGSMQDPLKHAMGLRAAQDAKKMRMWDSAPSLFQNTIFHGEQNAEIKALRKSDSLEEKLEFAKELKEEGNDLLKRGDLEKAIESYEKGAGIFRYIECVRPDWKNDDGSYKGIEDEWLVVHGDELLESPLGNGNTPEAKDARTLITSCYLNIALAQQKMGRFKEMKQACDEVLDDQMGRSAVDPISAKAYFRRAQALLSPMSATEEDRSAALQDLQNAAKISPNDKMIREMLTELKTEMREQKKVDKANYGGFFDRGQIVTKAETEKKDDRAKPQLDLRDPRVQAMLDVHPGPAAYDNGSPRQCARPQGPTVEELEVDEEDEKILKEAGMKNNKPLSKAEKANVLRHKREAAEEKVKRLKKQLEKAEEELRTALVEEQVHNAAR